jgi:hypothetical protein
MSRDIGWSKTALDYAAERRGGGTGGLLGNKDAKIWTAGNTLMVLGEMRTNFSPVGGNSNLKLGEYDSDFFSDFFPAAMALQRGQGCLPSKVLHKAAETESVCRFSAIIAVHAML